MTLIVLSKEVTKRILAGQMADRSQCGSKTCFRNEKLNGMSIIIDIEFPLPVNGVLEFDFVYLIDKPSQEDIISQHEIDMLLDWFKCKHE